ncbi:hypothetical protein [Microseira wollei]|uniref:Uncharacterized protein n=1 Tax=Microseira wollei NIES-4236 TaxID=2530354 RepID=A0AAV3XMM3_9CYAN|nr:hypothetical protein [Microseira wollei]GET44162.1 hypothetical protein MiSe_89880 [Microseira wollei NIES-4236]
MPRDNARKILAAPKASHEDILRAIYWLSMDLTYLINSASTNPAQETSQDIKESQELLERLRARVAGTGG